MVIRTFGISILVTIVSLVVAFLYGGWTALALCLILGILEVSLSFDNAVINATVLEKMSEFWQRIFLTIGILIAVFGMRLLFPLLDRLGHGRTQSGRSLRPGHERPGGGFRSGIV